MDVEYVITIILFGLSILTFFLGQKTGAQKEGEKQGELLTELKYIKKDLSDLRTDFKLINAEKIHAELNELRERQMKYDKSIIRLHDRLDEHLTKHHNISVERR